MTSLSIKCNLSIKSDRLYLSAITGNYAGSVRRQLANSVTFLVVSPLLNLEIFPPLAVVWISGLYRPTMNQGLASLEAYPTCEGCADKPISYQ